MAIFKDYLTIEGERMLANAAAGTTIRFTKIVAGSGYMNTGTNERNMTGVIVPVMEIPVTTVVISSSNSVVISAYMNNSEISSGFYFREKGIYATDGQKEVLMIYANNGNDAEKIDPPEIGIIEKKLRSVLELTSQEAANIEIRTGIYALAPIIPKDIHSIEEFINLALAETVQLGQKVIIDGKLYTFVGTDKTNADDYFYENIPPENMVPTFTRYTVRENISSGEKLGTILGKIAKFFADLKKVAFTGNYIDLSNKPDSIKNPYEFKANGKSYDGSESVDMGTLGVEYGGTGAKTAAEARTNLGLGNVQNAKPENMTPVFTQATTRVNIGSGEKMGTILGKIAKFFFDLKAAAFAGIANNCTTTVEGYALDARQGKELREDVDQLYSNMGIKSHYLTDECSYYKSGNVVTVVFNPIGNITYKAGSNNIGQLPTGFKPPCRIVAGNYSEDNNAKPIIYIYENGTIQVQVKEDYSWVGACITFITNE